MTHTSIGMAWWWALIVVLSMGMCLVLVMSAQGHDQVILQCAKNIPIKEVFLIGTAVLENGMVSELYSKTPGGPGYIEALSPASLRVPGQDHDPFPLFYVVDTDGDGEADVTYEDTAWDEPDLTKHCDKIVEVDLRTWNKRKEM